jgi:putative PIN family toxin of toxin-antitoxin system
MTGERVVIDTNVLVSFLLRHGSIPWRAVRLALEVDQLMMSEATYGELCDVLRRRKFDAYVARDLRESFLRDLPGFATFVTVRERVRACVDPTDDRFLETAINSNAGILVTGDRALLAMRAFRNVRIMTPTAYVRLAEGR